MPINDEKLNDGQPKTKTTKKLKKPVGIEDAGSSLARTTNTVNELVEKTVDHEYKQGAGMAVKGAASFIAGYADAQKELIPHIEAMLETVRSASIDPDCVDQDSEDIQEIGDFFAQSLRKGFDAEREKTLGAVLPEFGL